jgi:hypothetical protein
MERGDPRTILANLLASPSAADNLAPEDAALAAIQVAQIQARLTQRITSAAEAKPPAPRPEPERLLLPLEAARRLGVSLRWLYRNAKHLPFTRKLTKRTLRFHEQGLAKYIREKRP